MSAATPMRAVRVVGLSVFAVDYANHTDLVASCPDNDRALWLGSCLAQFHRVDFETADHGLEAPEVIWTPDMKTNAAFQTQMAIEVVPFSRESIIQEAADRLNEWLAALPAPEYQRLSVPGIIGKLRSYAAE